ncbi:Sec-independent protein translocase protein TatC [uncultured Desulfobacterium sp.]|uniref:Sec-independent protein translocase protein TatC n=1 Tax=uncultured Desulfobacterium sp. TaxID=201089 RepID=A0A445MUZ8_9BACT|nr:Sec-independent protein translocase protein TatC [uncultured Desulfobacterium sp.]
MADQEKMPFLSHLEELRKRLISCVIAVALCFAICYYFSESLFQFLIQPLKAAMPEGSHLVFTGLPEMFVTYLKVAFVGGVLLAAPFLFYEIWMFVAPGLYRHEKKLVAPFVASSTILFVGGTLFGYYIAFPFGFKFLMGYSSEYVKPLPSAIEYFNFSLKLLFAFGIIFEVPIFIFFLARLGIVTTDNLKKSRKYAILGAFIVAAILTPPDVVSQFIMAGPLIVLYEAGILISKMAKSSKAQDKEKTEAGR